jgi:hypothetical protein
LIPGIKVLTGSRKSTSYKPLSVTSNPGFKKSIIDLLLLVRAPTEWVGLRGKLRGISLLPELPPSRNPGKEPKIPSGLGIDDPSIGVEVLTVSGLVQNLGTSPLESTPLPTIAMVDHLESTPTVGHTIFSNPNGWG